MNNEKILKKLRIKPIMKYAVINRPSDLSEYPGESAGIKKQQASDLDALLLFVDSKEDLRARVQKVMPALSPDTVFWISYSKKSSGTETDLHRDVLRQTMKDYDYQAVSQIAINDIWSAMRFKPAEKVTSKKVTAPGVDVLKRTVRIPKDLQAEFGKNKEAKACFEKLSFTHKKEYIIWIETAKKESTRSARIEKTIMMLKNKSR
jgi:hypothetical protein